LITLLKRSDDGVDYYLMFKVGPIARSEPLAR